MQTIPQANTEAAQCGLPDSDLAYIRALLAATPQVERGFLFGSRARGDYKRGSDVDIALEGKDLTPSAVAHIHNVLEDESPMPYLFDVVDASHLNSEELRRSIAAHKILLYERR
jgi:predicted nucleotidyltransferase